MHACICILNREREREREPKIRKIEKKETHFSTFQSKRNERDVHLFNC